jgi:hypothetical protein
LYPVKVAADYLADLTGTVSGNDEAPGLKKVISIQKTDRDMDAISDDGLQAMYRHRIGAPEAVIVESLADDIDLPIDETLATTNMMTMTREMSGTLTMTQWMSGTLSMTREMSGTLYGPGQCVGDIDNCPPEIDIPLGYTHTNTSGLEAPYEYKGDVDQQPVIEQPDPALGFGPGEPSVEEVKEPVGNTPSGNSGATDTEQKKGGK